VVKKVALEQILDRDAERSHLEAAWRSATKGVPQLALVWGRRRVGKTFLVSHLASDKPRAVFFGATEQAEEIELARLAEVCRHALGPRSLDVAGGSFSGWEAALRFFVALAESEPLLVVIDEVPYLARSTPGFASIVQAVWDHVPPRTKLMLVLTGSAVGVIEDMTGTSGALRGRPTTSMRLDPIDLVSARVFLPDLQPVEYFEAYAACGGYPVHLKSWDQGRTVQANLLGLAASSGGLLLEDAEAIMGEELPSSGGYPRILAAIGRGRTRSSEIANEAKQRIEHPLGVLSRAGFVRKEHPVGAPKASRPLYTIGDPYLAFWFRVLYSDMAQIGAGQGSAVLERRKEEWQKHLGWVFEEAAREHAARLVRAGRLPGDLVIGRWWATSGGSSEVDVLGLRGSHAALLGEARWSDRPLGMSVLHGLKGKVTRVPKPDERPIFALWGRSGAEPSITREGVLGFSLEDVLAEESNEVS